MSHRNATAISTSHF